MYSCPERQREDRKPVLSGTGCQEVAWNKESQKYLRQGTLDSRAIQMLIDTGCANTMVSASYIKPDKLDYCNHRYNTEKILCVHGDMACYPNAEVNLRLGQWSQIAKVVVAPGIPVPILLGTDIYRLTTGKPVMVTTRAQAKRKDSASENRQPVIEPDTQNPKGNIESVWVEEVPTEQTNEVTKQYNETTVANLPIEQRREELLTSECQECNPLAEHIREWQSQDPTLQKAREGAGRADSDDRVSFYYEDGLLYRKWRPHEGDIRMCKQLVLPQQCQQLVLHLAYDVPRAGHMGITKTKNHLLQHYYWPGIFTEVRS